jgi:hypothetical protein
MADGVGAPVFRVQKDNSFQNPVDFPLKKAEFCLTRRHRTFRPIRNANQGGLHMTSNFASLSGRITP